MVVQIKTPNYTILIFEGADGMDVNDDNVDVEVQFADGERYGASFFTLENIRKLMVKDESEGNFNHGQYFWISDLIIINRLTHAEIQSAIDHMIEIGTLKRAFSRLEEG